MDVKTKTSQTSLLLSPRQYFVEIVETGFSKRNLKTIPAVQNYLVELLEFYLDAKNLFEKEIDETGNKKPSTLAEMYLTASGLNGSERHDLLKKLGDKTLYISGFFGDSLNRKLVDIEYYAEMGGAAYASLADISRTNSLVQVYRTFSERFLDFVDVLTYISHQTMVQSDKNVLRLYDRYMQTGSEVARDKLLEMGFLTIPLDQKKHTKQD
jgi:hypothetical protein